jgi:FPC/CPF motif-containing protein YcgG
MSTEDDKFKHSKRLLKDENAVKKQSKIAKQHRIQDYQSKVEKEPHRLHKRHAMDCGNPECYMCGNPRKTHKDKLTQQEKRLFQDLDATTDRKSNGLKPDEE